MVCFPEGAQGDLQACNLNGCKNITKVNLKSGEFSTVLSDPDFSPKEVYYLGVMYNGGFLFITDYFFLTDGSCDLCQPFQIYPYVFYIYILF